MGNGWKRGLVAAVVLVLASQARGDDAADLQAAKQHYQKGVALFDLGHYDEAIKEYELAYEAKSDPSFLFNIAQAHRKAHHVEQALQAYRAYLARATDTKMHDYVEARIAELEREPKSAPTPTAPVENKPSPSPAQVTPSPPVETATPAPTIVKPTVQTKRPVRARLVAGVVLGVVGLGLAVGGVALTALSANAADALSNADKSHLAYDPKLYATNQNDAIGGGIMLGIGVAALATGGALIAIDLRRGHEKRGNLARR